MTLDRDAYDSRPRARAKYFGIQIPSWHVLVLGIWHHRLEQASDLGQRGQRFWKNFAKVVDGFTDKPRQSLPTGQPDQAMKSSSLAPRAGLLLGGALPADTEDPKGGAFQHVEGASIFQPASFGITLGHSPHERCVGSSIPDFKPVCGDRCLIHGLSMMLSAIENAPDLE